MSDSVSILYRKGSWRQAISAFSPETAKDFFREPALWRPNNSPIEAYRLEPYLVEYPGSPLVVLVLSEEWDEERRQLWLERLRDPHTGKIKPRGKIQGLSDAARNRLAVQFKKIIPSECIDKSIGMALTFPWLTMIEEKAALKVFNNFMKRIERYCKKHGAKISGYRALERGPDGCTVHIHAWLWVSDASLLRDVHDTVQRDWPEAAGYQRGVATATDLQIINNVSQLAGLWWYMLKQEGKETISGVHPVATIRAQNLPIAKPTIEELDMPQADFLKKFINRILKRRNDPSPRRMIVNFPEEKWKSIKRRSYKHRRGPTPSEEDANKIRAAELGDDW
jgi:hypothetical protein